MRDADSTNFTKTIGSICYEDLKPISEDLQSISICGHVFHELCLQQWFEYSARAKKYTCPVCKQNCKQKDAGRLYFQSVLRLEVKRLEVAELGIRSAVGLQARELKELKEEKLRENKGKEFRLGLWVSDLDLDEDEVSKLSTLGNGANTKDTIDIIRESLEMSKRNYKDLINKYNGLAREARYKTAIKVKDNEVLRALKASKTTWGEGIMQNGGLYAVSDTRKETPTCNDTARTPATDIADVVILDDVEQDYPWDV
ncbi:hypothetical protein D8674_031128 [Pyrus ussuriensis x Pyrus communis]|uniref:RING-type domain-containing protein n=1 Tax=Pyrus ussuriensis x Pyrus communis TaxID=2448454 RepID=A0A5N5EXM5_9ROSA|nr:hypothetical protein D8674_031128 [Pyrus ussuriensis x Pyrus communis]